MALNSKQLSDILVLLERVNLSAKEALSFVQLTTAISNTMSEAIENEKRAPGIPLNMPPTGAIPPEVAAVAVASSDSVKSTRKVRKHVEGILREARKQQEGEVK